MDVDDLIRISDAIAAALTPPPKDAPDVCVGCRSWRDHPERGLCTNCVEVRAELSAPAQRAIPISLYRKPSLLRDWLSFYKPGRDEHHPEYSEKIGVILARLFLEHGTCLERIAGKLDGVCVVPSRTGGSAHALEAVYRRYVAGYGPPLATLLSRGSGDVGHRLMSDSAFAVTAEVRGQRLLVLDDVYTTGARAHSATSALNLAGAKVNTILVVARRVNPDYSDGVGAVWARQAGVPFSFKDRPFWCDR